MINQTEALVAIDVNTGKYVGRSNRLEDTIVKTNTEAVKEIVRQVRLRDLGGIIVVDFIDMDERKNRQKVMQALEDAMRSDRAPYKILQFNDFGLVAITRKRVKQSLERALCMPCPHCEGAGYVKSVQTIVNEILQEAGKIAAAVEGKDVMLRVHPDVAKFLKSNQNKYLEELEEILRRPVLVKARPAAASREIRSGVSEPRQRALKLKPGGSYERFVCASGSLGEYRLGGFARQGRQRARGGSGRRYQGLRRRPRARRDRLGLEHAALRHRGSRYSAEGSSSKS